MLPPPRPLHLLPVLGLHGRTDEMCEHAKSVQPRLITINYVNIITVVITAAGHRPRVLCVTLTTTLIASHGPVQNTLSARHHLIQADPRWIATRGPRKHPGMSPRYSVIWRVGGREWRIKRPRCGTDGMEDMERGPSGC